MSKAAFVALWCFVLVLPWDVVLYMPVLGSIPRLVGLAASAVGVAYILARRRIRPLSWFHLFAVLFVLWAGVSVFWSIDAEATRVRFLTYLQLVVLAWLIWEIAWSPKQQRALLQAYVLGTSVLAVATMYNYLSGAALLDHPERFAALNQNPNELGLTLVLGLPMAWYVSLSQPNRRIAWMWQLYLPVAIAAILLTASRGSFLAMLVALAIIPATQGRLGPRTKVALYALALGSLVLAARLVPEASLERIRTTQADIEAGYFGGRMAGVGAGAYGAAVEPTLHVEWSSHSVFLAIQVENGIVGLLLFFAMAAAVIKALRHLPMLERRCAIVLLLALAVGSFSMEWESRKQFWFDLGLLAAQGAQRATQTPVVPARRRAATV